MREERTVTIKIEVAEPPPGFGTPRRGYLYLPPDENTMVLNGRCWMRATDTVKLGGSAWIYCERISTKEAQHGHNTRGEI